MLNTQKMLIAAAALRQAQDNYNKKYNDMVSKATKDASADIAQFMCQKIASNSAGPMSAGMNTEADTQLVAPYSIMLEIGKGLTLRQLMQGGGYRSEQSASATSSFGDPNSNMLAGAGGAALAGGAVAAAIVTGGAAVPVMAGIGAVMALSGANFKTEIPGGTMETSAMFNREERICTITRVSRTRACKKKADVKVLFVNVGGAMECGEEKTDTKVQEIKL